MRQDEGNTSTNITWEGCNVSNRLNLGYDEDMMEWQLTGKYENVPATGSSAGMVRLAAAILANMQDAPENGPPMGLQEECEALPEAAARTLAQAWSLAVNRNGDVTDQQYRRLGGCLMAVAAHMLRESSPGAVWSDCTQPEFPFRLELDREETP